MADGFYAGKTPTGPIGRATSTRGPPTTSRKETVYRRSSLRVVAPSPKRPELLGKHEERIFAATGDVLAIRGKDSGRAYQAAQDYSLLAQQFFQARLLSYVSEVLVPVFGVKHYWYRYEFAKSRGQIHFRMFAITSDKQPHRLLHVMRGGGSLEEADALANWAWGSLSLTALHPAVRPEGVLELPHVRAPDGAWRPTKESDAASLLFRDASSFREHRIACANSYCCQSCSDYCLRAPNRGAKRSPSGAIHRECRMGSGRGATPGQCDTPGWPTRSELVVDPDPRGYEKLALPRNVRRMAQHSVAHTIGWQANGDVSVLLLRSDPADPDPTEIARVCKYVL